MEDTQRDYRVATEGPNERPEEAQDRSTALQTARLLANPRRVRRA